MPIGDPTYQKLAETARMCWRQARLTKDKEVAHLLRRMAKEFQQAAAKLDGGRPPDIGEDNDDTPIV